MSRFKNAEGILKNKIAERIEEREQAESYLLEHLTMENWYSLAVLLGERKAPWTLTEKKNLLLKIHPRG